MAGSIIKQADPALKFCLDLIKFPPVLPATDTRLSLRVAQSIESLTGSAQPTKEQFIRAVESLPPKYAFTKKRLLRNLMNDSQAPLNRCATRRYAQRYYVSGKQVQNYTITPIKAYYSPYPFTCPVQPPCAKIWNPPSQPPLWPR